MKRQNKHGKYTEMTEEDMKNTETAETAEAETETVQENEWTDAEAQEQAKEKEPEKEKPLSEAEQIVILTKKLAEAENLRLLALAEMDNQRKRAVKERDNLRAHVEQDTLLPFLQVFEHFSMAVKATQNAQNVDAIVKGMEMIQAEFDKAFSELGVTKIDAMGKEFDPALHEAVAQEASDTVPAGIVLKQWSFGFKSGDRLLKPAMVIVSSGKAEEA